MLQQLNNSLELIIIQTKQHLPILGLILLILWSVYLLSLFEKRILLLGIIPRHLVGLPGILFSPFLHANFNHLFFNSIPLIVLSNFLLINGIEAYLYITVIITVLSGFLLWCFGKPGLHVGASGLITGYWGFLVCNIYQQATLTAIILGVLSGYYFAGIFFGIFPQGNKGVSWEGHLFGLLSGVGLSLLIGY